MEIIILVLVFCNFFCSIYAQDNAYNSMKITDKRSLIDSANTKNSYQIAVLLPVCSRNMNYFKYDNIKNVHLLKYFIPSFVQTISKVHAYKILIGIDDTDDFYMKNIKSLESALEVNSELFNFEIVVLTNCEHNPVKAWNTLFEIAINKNLYDYFFQANDDILFRVPWTEKFIETLQSNDNIGVVGGIEQNNYNWRIRRKLKPIIENAFVHRTHYNIFKTLYSKEITNWHSDTWITNVYPSRYAVVIPSITFENRVRDKRYRIQKVKESLPKLIDEGKQTFERFKRINA